MLYFENKCILIEQLMCYIMLCAILLFSVLNIHRFWEIVYFVEPVYNGMEFSSKSCTLTLHYKANIINFFIVYSVWRVKAWMNFWSKWLITLRKVRFMLIINMINQIFIARCWKFVHWAGKIHQAKGKHAANTIYMKRFNDITFLIAQVKKDTVK